LHDDSTEMNGCFVMLVLQMTPYL